MTRACTRSSSRTQAVVGVLILATGLTLLGHQLGWQPGWSFDGLWPIILVVAGVLQVVTDRGRHGRGIGLTTVGVVLLLHTLSVLPLRDGWPLLIVGQGVAMLVRSGREREPRRELEHGR